MNIIFVSEYFWPEIGGLERSTERLAEELINNGHTVKMITRLIPDTKHYEKRNNIQVYRFPEEGITFTAEAKKAGLFDGAEVICLFGVGHDSEAKYWKELFSIGVPVFVKIGTQGDMINKNIPYTLFKQFNAILCQNDGIIEEAIEIGVETEKCQRIKNGLNIAQWRENMLSKDEARMEMNIPKDTFVCSAIGRYVIRKNFPMIISAFLRAVKTDIKMRENSVLLLQGSDFGQHDGEEELLRKIAQEANNIVDIRFIPAGEDTSITLSASDVFITMGQREGAPNIIIEALATGCPVIASHIPGHDVYIRNEIEGFLVDFSEKELATAILNVFNNKELASNMSVNALERSKNFDIKITAQGYLEIFKGAVNKGFSKNKFLEELK